MRERNSMCQRNWADSNSDSERISKLHAFLLLETGEAKPPVPGVPAEVVEYALSTMKVQPEKSDRRVVSEDWGDMMKLIGKCISGFVKWLIKAVFRFM